MKKFTVYLCTIALTVIIILSSLSKAVEVGNNLNNIFEWLDIVFYVLLGLILYFLLIKPVFIVLFAPYYSIRNIQNNSYSKNKRLASNLIKRNVLNEKTNNELIELINNKKENELNERINKIYEVDIKKIINDLVIKSSKETMFLTAVSQNGTFDSLIVLINNFRLVKKIIVICGFRPNFFRLIKLYLNILISTFIAEGLEKVDISSLISSSIQGTSKVLTNSVFNGVSNAFLMLRVGMLTKLYLYADDPKKEKITLKNNALIEATKLLPSFISELVFGTVTTVVNSIGKVFTKEKKEKVVE